MKKRAVALLIVVPGIFLGWKIGKGQIPTTTTTFSTATTSLKFLWRSGYLDSEGHVAQYQEPVRFNFYMRKKGYIGKLLFPVGVDTFTIFTKAQVPDSTLCWVTALDSVNNESSWEKYLLIHYETIIVPPPPPPTPSGYLVYRKDNAMDIAENYSSVSGALKPGDVFGLDGWDEFNPTVASISTTENLYGMYEISILGCKSYSGDFKLVTTGSTFPFLLPVSDTGTVSLVRMVVNFSVPGQYALTFLSMGSDVKIKSIEYRRLTVGDVKPPGYPVQLIVTGSP